LKNIEFHRLAEAGLHWQAEFLPNPRKTGQKYPQNFPQCDEGHKTA
jgi:hypothetical protein